MTAYLLLVATLALGGLSVVALGEAAARALGETERPASASPHVSALPAVIEGTE